jgi:hypothetical protein
MAWIAMRFGSFRAVHGIPIPPIIGSEPNRNQPGQQL